MAFMNTGAFFLILALLILVALYLYAPFMRRDRTLSVDESHEISALMAERDRVINALQELDFDFSLGKILADDYPVQRAALLQKGADVLRRLDELDLDEDARGETAARIEQAVGSRRPDAASENSDLSDDDLESLIAARRKVRKDRSAGFCPRCGKPVMVTDRFCPACGKSLT